MLEHTAGTPLREGGGDETYRCGRCKTTLLVDVAHHDAHGVIEKCGKFDHIAKPGLQFLIPCVQAVSGTISMRLQQMEVSCETKSKDNVRAAAGCALPTAH